MIRKKGATLVLSGLLLSGGGIAYADFVDGLVGGVVGGVVGSVITNEVYRKGRRHRVTRKRVRHTRKRHVVRRSKKVYRAPVVVLTTEKKIQKALSALGFYHGAIDGQINAYETRSAIKAMNNAYERGNTATLDTQTKDTLTYLGDLFTLDRYLVSRGTDRRSKAKKLQAALKIHGTYHGKIDGAVGRGTRTAIAAYTGGSSSLDFEQEYRLIESAKKKNDRNIEDAIASLKGHNATRPMGANTATPATQQDNQPVILQPAN